MGAKEAIIFVILLLCSFTAFAIPKFDRATSGTVNIKESKDSIVVTANKNFSFLKWDSFNVAKPETVTFKVPNKNSIVVNKVIDKNASFIDGTIRSRDYYNQQGGTIIIINPNGIIFGRDSVIDVGSFNAVAANIEDIKHADDLDDGHLWIEPGPGNVINYGEIKAKGFVTLLGQSAHNYGQIFAVEGEVSLKSFGGDRNWKCIGDDLIQYAYARARGPRRHPRVVEVDPESAAEIIESVVYTGDVEHPTHVRRDGSGYSLVAQDPQGEVVQHGTISSKGKHKGHVRLEGTRTKIKEGSNIEVEVKNGKRATVTLKGEESVDVDQGSSMQLTSQEVQPGGLVEIEGGRINYAGDTIITAEKGKRGEIHFKGRQLSLKGSVDISGNNPGLIKILTGNVSISSHSGISSSWLSSRLEQYDVQIRSDLVSDSSIGLTAGGGLHWDSPRTLLLRSDRMTFSDRILSPQGVVVLAVMKKFDAYNSPLLFSDRGSIESNQAQLYYRPENYHSPQDFSSHIRSDDFISAFGITNLAELSDVRRNLAGKYALLSDIDMQGKDFVPFTHQINNPFTGVFDGRYYTVRNMTIDIQSKEELQRKAHGIGMRDSHAESRFSPNEKSYFIGMFGVIEHGTVKNLKGENIRVITGNNAIVGSLAGMVLQNSIIDNVDIRDIDVQTGQDSFGGGLTGSIHEGAKLSNIVLNGQVHGGPASNLGGLAAHVRESEIELSEIDVNVFGGDGVLGKDGMKYVDGLGMMTHSLGGAVGLVEKSNIRGVNAYGNVEGGNHCIIAGGFCGNLKAGEITESGAWGNVSVGSTKTIAGGFVGQNESGHIFQSHAHGSASGKNEDAHVGGFVGRNNVKGIIEDSYSTGAAEVGVKGIVGSFAGANSGTCTEYKDGKKIKIDNKSIIRRVYASGEVKKGKRSHSGGFVGGNDGKIKDSYYDVKSTNKVRPMGFTKKGVPVKGIVRKTTEELVKPTKRRSGDAYHLWDPKVWLFPRARKGEEFRPFLQIQQPKKTHNGEYHVRSPHDLKFAIHDPEASRIFVERDMTLGTVRAGNFTGHGFPSVEVFKGFLSGMGQDSKRRHTISGLKLRTGGRKAKGLFDETNGAYIENLELEGSITAEAGSTVGLAAGKAIDTYFSNVGIKGEIQAGNGATVGLLAGDMDQSEAHFVNVDGAIIPKGGTKLIKVTAGGIVGNVKDSLINMARTNVYFSRSKNSYLGGIVGISARNTLVRQAVSVGAFARRDKTRKTTIGGVSGNSLASDFMSSYWDSEKGPDAGIGGYYRVVVNGSYEGISAGRIGSRDSFEWTFFGQGGMSNWVMAESPHLITEWDYRISKPWHLPLMYAKPTERYVLVDSIKMGMQNWNGNKGFVVPQDIVFSGSFDGGNHSLYEVAISADGDTNNVGLFPRTKNAYIHDLRVQGDIITAKREAAGPLYAGLLVGKAEATTLDHIDVDGGAKGDATTIMGGIVGELDKGSKLLRSKAKFVVDSTAEKSVVAGLCASNRGLIQDSYSHDSSIETGEASISAGLVGINQPGGTIRNTYAFKNPLLYGTIVAGLVGENNGAIINSYVMSRASDKLNGNYTARLVVAQGASGSISKSRYNKQEGGAAAIKRDSGRTDIMELTQAEMQKRENFATWDFDTVWGNVEGSSTPFFRWDMFPLSVRADIFPDLTSAKIVLPNQMSADYPKVFDFENNYILLPRTALKQGDLIALLMRNKKDKAVELFRYAKGHEGFFELGFTPGVRLTVPKGEQLFSAGLLMEAATTMVDRGIPKKHIPYEFDLERKEYNARLIVHGNFEVYVPFLLNGNMKIKKRTYFELPLAMLGDTKITAETLEIAESSSLIGKQQELRIKAKEAAILTKLGVDLGDGLGLFDIKVERLRLAAHINALNGINFNKSKITLEKNSKIESPYGKITYHSVDGAFVLKTISGGGDVEFTGAVGSETPLSSFVIEPNRVYDEKQGLFKVGLSREVQTTGDITLGPKSHLQLGSDLVLRSSEKDVTLHTVTGDHKLEIGGQTTSLLRTLDIGGLRVASAIDTLISENIKASRIVEIPGLIQIGQPRIVVDAQKDPKRSENGGILLGEVKNGEKELMYYSGPLQRGRVSAVLYLTSDFTPEVIRHSWKSPILIWDGKKPVFKEIMDRLELPVPIGPNAKVGRTNGLSIDGYNPKAAINRETRDTATQDDDDLFSASDIDFNSPDSKVTNINRLVKIESAA